MTSEQFPLLITDHCLLLTAKGVFMEKKVFIKRIEEFKILMVKNSLDYCIATPGTNFYYLSGIDTFRMERLIAVIIPIKGEPFIICPSFEEERLRKETCINNFYPWKEDENPYEILEKIIKSRSMKYSCTGIEPTTHFETFVKLKDHLTGMEFKDGSSLFSTMRRKKTEEEIEALKKAVDITEKNIDYALSHLKPGMKEEELKKYLTGDEKLVQFGETSSYPHSEGGKNILQKNDVVLIDKGDMWEKYHSDITRTAYFGKGDEDFFKIWHIVREARDRAIEKAGPGIPCEVVDKSARDVIEREGYGEYFTHRTGHGLGLDIHEMPYLVKGNMDLLEPGNVITIEPGIYLPGKFGVRIEEDVVITRNGREVLSRQPQKPDIIED